MTITTYFPIEDMEAVAIAGSIELRVGENTVLWMTFFDSGIFTVREHGRAHAGRFPAALLEADIRERVSYALADFRGHGARRRAA